MSASLPLSKAPPGPVAFGPYVLDYAQARLLRDGQPVALLGRPLQLLALLAAHPGRLLDKDEVLDGVWGHEHLSDSVLKVAVNTLRKALGDNARVPRYIETVARRGYRFLPEVTLLVAPNRAAGPAVVPAGGLPVPASPPQTDEPAPPREAPGPGNLPPAGEALVGRDELLNRLAALQRQHRLLTLTGLGGVGKTRLALALAAQSPPPDGAWLVRLDDLADADQLLPTIAGTLKLGSAASASAAGLVRVLGGMQLRLVLDNAEHLIDAVATLVAELHRAAPSLQLLVTSQLPLRVAGEQAVAIAPLGLPDDPADAAPDPQAYAAARLLCARVHQTQPDWWPRPDEHADLAAICRALDGVPLALELAAARVPLLGVAGVRARLDERFALLTRAPRDVATRHRSLAAALDWTFELLQPAEQDALCRLAVFAGSFSPASAEAVLAAEGTPSGDAPLDLVDSLRERSLLVSESLPGQGVRLRLFDSVRRHALARLQGRGGEHGARRRHLLWALALALRAEEDYFCRPTQAWLPAVRHDADSLRAALQFGLDAAPADEELRDTVQRLAAASVVIWLRIGVRREMLAWLDRARALPARPATALALDSAYALHVAHGLVGDLPAALQAAERAIQAHRAAGDRRRTYIALYCLRHLQLRLQPQADATPLIEEMAALVEPAWNALTLRLLYNVRGIACRDRGDFEGYVAAFSVGAEALRAAGGAWEAWTWDMGQAQGLALLGRRAEACAVLGRSVASLRAAGALREQPTVVAMNAMLQLWEGTPDAPRAAREAVRLLQAEDMVWWMADALPWAAWHDGRPEDAARLQAWADGLVARRGEARGPVFSLMRQAMGEALRESALDGAASLPAPSSEASALELALPALPA